MRRIIIIIDSAPAFQSGDLALGRSPIRSWNAYLSLYELLNHWCHIWSIRYRKEQLKINQIWLELSLSSIGLLFWKFGPRDVFSVSLLLRWILLPQSRIWGIFYSNFIFIVIFGKTYLLIFFLFPPSPILIIFIPRFFWYIKVLRN